ncbi:Protein of unknown function [Devosia sp. YR412]|uniref:DUF1761 domain-containing protein n=1 Tax=Devosia sp. YR412 TaxID=1881030 RepID=UPI0008CAE78C|nr:DUF1761 domain-containing protein [Devosia sp. YR412]SEP80829.1 Protein of unknown function [Devosia sp. YR412]
MLAPFAGIHWLAVVAGTFVFAALGAAYFMAIVPKQYLYVTGRENLPREQQATPGLIFILGPILCGLVNVIADAYFIAALGITHSGDAALLGLIIGLGFLVPMAFNIAINPLFPRPLQYALLNAPYFLVSNIIACILLVVIPW